MQKEDMLDEQYDPSGSNRVSIVLFKELVPIGRSFLKENERKTILDYCLSKNLEQLKDNLVETERTDWYLHEDEGFSTHVNFLKKHIWDTMAQMTSYPDKNFNTEYYTEVDLFDCWFAKCKKGGYTDPHNHGNVIGQYSFVCYLQIPSKTSSLTFASNSFEFKERVIVREGDVLVFPSHFKHWSFDTEENRAILSGNFIWSIKRSNDEEDKNDNLMNAIKSKVGQLNNVSENG